MKQKKLWFALSGLLLLGLGFFFQNLDPYRPLRVISSEASCRMAVDVVEPISGTAQGYAVLFHGVAANRRIMSYLAQDLANQNLRVFVPDSPGHGKTPGPFTPLRASDCGEALVRELIERRAIVPEQTILAGHSMGGAIAIRASARVPVAGVIAISPAPMRTTKLLSKELVFFPDDPPLAKNTLIITGSHEPAELRRISLVKVKETTDGTSKYIEIPHATHVSLLFDSDVLGEMRKWTNKLLGADPEVVRASHYPLIGYLCGMIGLILLCVPFVGETVGGTGKELNDGAAPIPTTRILGQLIVASAIAVGVLRFWVPLKIVGLFQGDYLASFALILGVVLLAWNWSAVTTTWRFTWGGIAAAAIAAIILVLLFGLWFEYSFYEAWLTGPKWARMAPMMVAFFPWLMAEEIFLGAHATMSRVRRAILTLAFRSIAWAMIVAAMFLLHTGEVLMVLLVLYFVLVSLLQRLAMDVVRRETHSPAATALFGAILSAGFALAIFPLA
ncbi:MAG TPA: alpha/beta fold hydrolase [Candidatus Dormibacteraeota bacterium]|jgi:pimeloyl-ACP methyl ester carboxylesterase|nr:alpha/beta fold hydrolase [Candidatus Dormibacteraeota bacterium]